MSAPTAERPTFHNDRTERALIGCMLRDNRVIGDVVQEVSKDDLHGHAAREMFDMCVRFYDKGKPATAETVADALHREKKLEDVGGYGGIAEFIDAAVIGEGAIYHARAIRERSLLKALNRVGHRIAQIATECKGPAREAIDEAQRELFEVAEHGVIGEVQELSEVLPFVAERLDDRWERRRNGDLGVRGVPTGFFDLDDLMCGLQDGELIIVAARPSAGKTSFGITVAAHCLRSSLPILFMSLEQSKLELAERLLIQEAEVDGHLLRTGCYSADDAARLVEAQSRLASKKFLIDDRSDRTLLQIATNARRMKSRHGIKLLIVDYLQLIVPDNSKDVRQEQVAKISRRLKGLARDLNIPVLVMAQLNRAVESRADGKPKLSDLRESGQIEADADVVLLMHRQEEENAGPSDVTLVAVNVAKQRNGRVGEIVLALRKKFMRFENYASPKRY